MKSANGQELKIRFDRPEDGAKGSTDGGYFRLTSLASWLEGALGSELQHGGVHYLYAYPGAGKSTVALMAAIDRSLSGEHTLILSTERTEDAVRSHLLRLLRSIPVSRHSTVLNRISVTDRITSLRSLPDFLEGALHSSHTSRPNLIIIDSINGDGVHSCSKTFDGLYEAFKLCRSERVTCFAIGHVTKRGEHSGPQAISHSADTVSALRVGSQRRYFQVAKNRFGPISPDPLVLEMDEFGCLRPSQHAQPAAVSVMTLDGSLRAPAEIQTALSVPPLGRMGRVQCPGLPRGVISQVLQSLERDRDLHIPISQFSVDISLVSDAAFSRTMLFPIAAGCLASLDQIEVPQTFWFVGELDLNLNLRAISPGQRRAIGDWLSGREGETDHTLVCPACEVSDLRGKSAGTGIIGFESFPAFVDMLRGARADFLQRAA